MVFYKFALRVRHLFALASSYFILWWEVQEENWVIFVAGNTTSKADKLFIITFEAFVVAQVIVANIRNAFFNFI